MSSARRRRTLAQGAAALAVFLAAAYSGTLAQATTDPLAPTPVAGHLKAGRYVVTLSDEPVARYRGGVKGLPATAPAAGGKVDAHSGDAHRYQDYLRDRQSRVAASVDAKIDYRYTVVTDGFSANLTAGQAMLLSRQPGVLDVSPDRVIRTTDDSSSTDFMGLSGPHGVWSALGGTAKSGKGVVIGDIDSGIWPESASFDAPALGTAPPTAEDPYRPYRDGDVITMKKADGGTFTGTCQTGQAFTADDCNTKIVSARYFPNSYLSTVPPQDRVDYISARDFDGHGTHTASTAAGDANVPVTVEGRDFGKISGVAPGAAIAVYKAFWEPPGLLEATSNTSVIVAAVDQAVADGVDVLNYSNGNEVETRLDDPVQQAFLAAAQAGVFVSAAAGNQGPGPSSLDNTPPWVTTVAASTLKPHEATVVLGDGRSFVGGSDSVPAALGPKPLVLAGDVKAATATADAARLCRTGSLDPAKAAGKVVVCDRGTTTRLNKSAEVKRAGGVGMVAVNTKDEDVDSDITLVPSVHLNVEGGTAVRDYAATPGATVTLRPGGSSGTSHPQIAPFSSRGPSVQNKGALIKPDLAAPGVSVLAAVSPANGFGHDFGYDTGTSMATPQITGLAALYYGVHPKWSPMAVKSAMMTTAVDTKTASGGANTDPYAQGSGEVNPAAMLDPGLVYDSSGTDWLAYEEGLGINTGTGTAPVAPSDLNYPSISVDRLIGTRTITRTLTATRPGVYRASTQLPGFDVRVSPSTLRFTRPGQTAEVSIELTRTTAAWDTPVTGFLTWKGSGHITARSPIAVTPKELEAPGRLSVSGSEGSVSYPVTPGTDKLTLTAYAPVAGRPVPSELTAAAGGEQDFVFTVPDGAKAGEFFATTDDPDRGVWLVIAPLNADGSPGSEQYMSDNAHQARVSLSTLRPGKYAAAVIGFPPGESSIPFTLQSNVVGADIPTTGTFTVTPTSAATKPNVPVAITGRWSGVDTSAPATAYVGYQGGDNGTLISIS